MVASYVAVFLALIIRWGNTNVPWDPIGSFFFFTRPFLNRLYREDFVKRPKNFDIDHLFEKL
jgi:hypothetical protein|tara:strand:- start:329 stop:514 length:186 start_codon:yes stop_codon:yes gene_type:complete